MFDKIQMTLNDYQPVSLHEIEAVKLMNRVDTKYIVPIETMMCLLDDLTDDYLVLEIATQRFGQYSTVYYDTPDLQMFHSHVTARFPRFKVRERTYSQNGVQFLEVKRKKPDGRTSKKRLPLERDTCFDAFVAGHTPFRTEDLHPKLNNRFSRITLVNRAQTERLTLDFDLQFSTFDGAATPVFNHAAIVELKQDKKSNSVIANRLRDENIRPCGMSKYCVGMLLLNNHLSYKMYKKNFVKFINHTTWNISA
jgi:hypothetical protein